MVGVDVILELSIDVPKARPFASIRILPRPEHSQCQTHGGFGIEEAVKRSYSAKDLKETWLNEAAYPDLHIALPEAYTCVHLDRVEKRGGGVGIIYKKIFRCNSFKRDELLGAEALGFSLLSGGQLSFSGGFVYCPPGHLDSLDQAVIPKCVSYAKFTILDDFNIDLDKMEDPLATRLVETRSSFNMIRVSMGPTHDS
ncbi:hypothetical protein NDU88_006354 [Pleurodeles waltl]|uniref:Uncharacterized protein n=1 Tax=Pleurodeles waltl TaxID=8319 RepID=A0AAV7WY03_PLEWA|nr:hypothetical protein NDU88_006354 [Pleurodeles waltl]